MSSAWNKALDRWLNAGLVDAPTVAKIREWEAQHGDSGSHRLSGIAFALGGMLLAAGILLFVSAHWDELSATARFSLVLSMVALLHVGGALTAASSPRLSMSLHAVGTAALGGGIFLCGQIFNMAEHWPGAVLLWAIGAAIALWLLRDWPHVLWVALLGPAWLWGEWLAAHETFWRYHAAPGVGTFGLAVAYLAACRDSGDEVWRKALTRLGAVAIVPAAISVSVYNFTGSSPAHDNGLTNLNMLAWILAIVLPLATAWLLRGRQAIYTVAALAWALVVSQIDWRHTGVEILFYALYASAAAGLVWWGTREQMRLHINLGVLGFALTIFAFYFSSVFDKLGRSVGLIGLGALFLGGGWLLERTRRRLIAAIEDRA